MEGKRIQKLEKTIARMALELESAKEKFQLERGKNKLLGGQIKSMEEKLCSSKQKNVLLKQE
jgi:hypothetical protein